MNDCSWHEVGAREEGNLVFAAIKNDSSPISRYYVVDGPHKIFKSNANSIAFIFIFSVFLFSRSSVRFLSAFAGLNIASE